MASRFDTSEQTCVCGSNIDTRLRCSRCGKPICPECMIESPVGYRCPECSAGTRAAAYRTTNTEVFKALVVGLLVAGVVGVVWGYYPSWQFYLALLLGFGTAEGMAWAASYKKGGDLQAAAFGCVLLGILISRYTIALVTPGLTVDMLFQNLGSDFVRQVFYLHFIPDFLFMVIPFVIVYVRFK